MTIDVLLALRTPLDPLHGDGYGFWSGIGGDLFLVGVGLTAWRHINCHTPWCLRLGRYRVAGTAYRLCKKHHPDVPDDLSLRSIHEATRQKPRP